MVALMNQKRIQFDSKLYKNSHSKRSFPGAIKCPSLGCNIKGKFMLFFIQVLVVIKNHSNIKFLPF